MSFSHYLHLHVFLLASSTIVRPLTACHHHIIFVDPIGVCLPVSGVHTASYSNQAGATGLYRSGTVVNVTCPSAVDSATCTTTTCALLTDSGTYLSLHNIVHVAMTCLYTGQWTTSQRLDCVSVCDTDGLAASGSLVTVSATTFVTDRAVSVASTVQVGCPSYAIYRLSDGSTITSSDRIAVCETGGVWSPTSFTCLEDAVETACNSFTTYPTTYIGKSCYVRVPTLQTYTSAVATCGGLTLSATGSEGRLASTVVQRRPIMNLIRTRLPVTDTNHNWVSLTQVDGSGEPLGTWQICVNAAQTDCHQLAAEDLPWSQNTMNNLVEPNNDPGEQDAGIAFLGNNVNFGAGLGDTTATNTANVYTLCEFSGGKDDTYFLVATNSVASRFIRALTSTTQNDCATACTAEQLCVSYVHNPTSLDCRLQYMMFTDAQTYDRTTVSTLAGWSWYEPMYT